jgi:hypothetical protein
VRALVAELHYSKAGHAIGMTGDERYSLDVGDELPDGLRAVTPAEPVLDQVARHPRKRRGVACFGKLQRDVLEGHARILPRCTSVGHCPGPCGLGDNPQLT